MIPAVDESFFHIFSGSGPGDAVWVEVVRGLGCARERLDEIARENPGKYLLFSFARCAILAKVDTAGDLMGVEILGRDAAH